MKVLRDGWKWLADDAHQLKGVRVLQVAIGLAILFRVFTEAPFAAFLWGPTGLGWGHASDVIGPILGNLLDRVFTSNLSTFGVLIGLAGGAIGLVFGYWTRASTAVALVAFFLLETRLPELGDGGDNIIQLVLIYGLFLLPAKAKRVRGSVTVWIHNIGVLAIAFQLFVIYETSGMMKAYGEQWHHGVAMYYISQVEWFSLPAMRTMFKNPIITTVATYVPMFYQILFPIAIISRIKLPWLFVGVIFHLGVAIFMGLITFSIVMIGLELFFITDPQYTRIIEHVRAGFYVRTGRSRLQPSVTANATLSGSVDVIRTVGD